MPSAAKFLSVLFCGLVCLMYGLVPRVMANEYTTTFSTAQNPLSESGMWLNGGTTGLDWGNVQAISGLVYGASLPSKYGDPGAVLTGTWAPDQTVQATVRVTSIPTVCCHDVELRLRTTIAAHSITGYVVSCSVVPTSPYLKVTRWNGAIGNFNVLYEDSASACANGDILKVSVTGSTLSVFKNGVQLASVTDDAITSGSPGVGFYDDGDNNWSSFGFSSFTASDAAAQAAAQKGVTAAAQAAAATSGTYTTNFPLTENPISEGGSWVGGQNAGGNLWGNLQTKTGLAFGVSEPTTYGDPTAILTGNWSADQTASATIKIVSTPTTCCHEVELRLRSTVSANSITGYELLCPVAQSSGYGYQIVRWNGRNGQYVYIGNGSGAHQCVNGDVLMGTATGTNPTTIKFYNNGNLVASACDNGGGPGASCGGYTYSGPGGAAGPFTTGNPGIGVYDDHDTNWSAFGFSSFTATGSSTAQNPSPPTSLKATVN